MKSIVISLVFLSSFFAAGCQEGAEVLVDLTENAVQKVHTVNRKAGVKGSRKPVRFKTDRGAYEFTPSTYCTIGREDGHEEFEVAGPGVGPEGKPVFVSVSTTGDDEAELSIEVGVDQPFKSGETRFQASAHITEPLRFQVRGSAISVSNIVLSDDGQRRVPVRGGIEIDCGAA